MEQIGKFWIVLFSVISPQTGLSQGDSGTQDGLQVYAWAGGPVVLRCETPQPVEGRRSLGGSWSWNKAKIWEERNLESALKPRLRMSTSRQRGNLSISLNGLRVEDAGTYECRIPEHRVRRTFQLHVLQVSPRTSRLVPEGGSVSLEVEGWKGEVRFLDPRKELVESSRRLNLEPVSLAHEGRWTLEIGPDLSQTYDLRVIGFSQPQNETLYASSGSRVRLPCVLNLSPGLGMKKGRWRRRGEVLVSWPTSEGHPRRSQASEHLNVKLGAEEPDRDLSLVLSGIGPADSGLYTCAADYEGVEMFRHLLLAVVQVAPPPGPVTAGANVSVTCCVTGPSPATRVSWGPGANRTRVGGSGEHVRVTAAETCAVLSLTRVTEREGGAWVCRVSEGPNNTQLEHAYRLLVTDAETPIVSKLLLYYVTPGVLGVLLIVILVLSVCSIKHRQTRRRRLRRMKYPLCRVHSNQLSNQPLCGSNDYVPSHRPLPTPPRMSCPHKQRTTRKPRAGAGGRVY